MICMCNITNQHVIVPICTQNSEILLRSDYKLNYVIQILPPSIAFHLNCRMSVVIYYIINRLVYNVTNKKTSQSWSLKPLLLKQWCTGSDLQNIYICYTYNTLHCTYKRCHQCIICIVRYIHCTYIVQSHAWIVF